MMIKAADRIASFKPYFFATLNQQISTMQANGIDVIRIDMGSPDLPPADFIITALEASARRPDTHGYSPIGGSKAYRQAVVNYYKRRFMVDLDVNREVLALIGSKEGLFNMSQVILNPGDVALIPDPGYPVYSAAAQIAGAEIYPLPLLRENGFLPDLACVPEDIARRAKLLWLNYPNNPTGAIATLDFFRQAVEFGRKYEVLVVHDAPYTDVCFDGYIAPSLLQVEGAKEVAVEMNSLSKTYNMAGWRVGMAVGNSQAIGYLNTYKSQMDSSNFTPVLEAAIAAMNGDQEWIDDRNQVYKDRRDIVVSGLRKAGFQVDVPPAAFYVWAGLPDNRKDSEEFCMQLLNETGVSTTPGVVYGRYGEGYLRISLVTPTARMNEAMQRIVAWVKHK